MELNRYLDRIKYTGPLTVHYNTLCQLLQAHLFHVPFENLDIFYRQPVVLDTAAFYDKIVLNNRGGYCYEVNRLFYCLLRNIGFKVEMISARIFDNGSYGPQYDHMALTVTIGNRQWLVDAGFGNFSLLPLAIRPGVVQNDGRENYQVREMEIDGRPYLCVGKWNALNGNYTPDYAFSTARCEFYDFSHRNNYQQSVPTSYFRRSLICSIPTADGRISIINDRLVQSIGQKKKISHVRSSEELQQLLEAHFGISFAVNNSYAAVA